MRVIEAVVAEVTVTRVEEVPPAAAAWKTPRRAGIGTKKVMSLIVENLWR